MRPNRTRVLVWAAVVALGASTGCSSSGGDGAEATPRSERITSTTTSTSSGSSTGATDGVRLVHHGGCGDVQFWASDATDTVAVVVAVGARERSATEASRLAFDAPTAEGVDPPEGKVSVHLDRGTGLSRHYCTDLPGGSHLASSTLVDRARGSVRLDPRLAPGVTGAPLLHGTLRLAEVVARDGTTFAPTTFTIDTVGFVSG